MNNFVAFGIRVWLAMATVYVALDVFMETNKDDILIAETAAPSGASVVDPEIIAYEESIRHEEQYDQVKCLAMNIYHEARSDSKLGQEAVGFVTMNRVYDDRYPDTVCDVVYQAHLDSRGFPIRNKCQFSWYCDGKRDEYNDVKTFKAVFELSEDIVNRYGTEKDITDGAVMYHASYVNPYWASSYERTSRIESHIFYK